MIFNKKHRKINKFNSMLCFLLVLPLSCGRYESERLSAPKVIQDERYSLSLTRGADSAYFFQVCSLQTDAQEDKQDEQDKQEKQEKNASCFNPFFLRGGSEFAVFAEMPALGNLRMKGVSKKVARRALEVVSVVGLAILAGVVVPKAAFKVFNDLWSLGKKSGKKGIKTIYEKVIEKMNRVERLKAIKKGVKPPTMAETEANLVFLQSKFIKFLSSLFVVYSVVEAFRYSYSGIKYVIKAMKDRSWGEADMTLADAFSHLSIAEAKSVPDVKKLLNSLRKHYNLVFSDQYLEVFEPAPEEEEENFSLPFP